MCTPLFIDKRHFEMTSFVERLKRNVLPLMTVGDKSRPRGLAIRAMSNRKWSRRTVVIGYKYLLERVRGALENPGVGKNVLSLLAGR